MRLEAQVLVQRVAGVAEPLVVAPPGTRALRVVSEPLDAKGFVERIVCGQEGRTRLRVLKREKSELLAALARTRRGDVVITPETRGEPG